MRQPTICQRKRRGTTTYYCQIENRQHGLGTDLAQANILFAELLAKHHARQELTAPVQPAQEDRPALTVSQAVIHGGSPLLTPLAGRHQEDDDGDHGEQ